jgi:hypothetical protein
MCDLVVLRLAYNRVDKARGDSYAILRRGSAKENRKFLFQRPFRVLTHGLTQRKLCRRAGHKQPTDAVQCLFHRSLSTSSSPANGD